VLHPPGAEHAPEQGAGGRDVGRYRALSGRAWPGRDIGVRAPEDGETALSRGEVEYMLDCMDPQEALELLPGSRVALAMFERVACEGFAS
jgi:hypothetical protein